VPVRVWHTVAAAAAVILLGWCRAPGGQAGGRTANVVLSVG
jgi:hypothetical protein